MPIFPIEQLPSITAGNQLWLDCADFNTIVQSGGLVSAWKDKSGQLRNATQGTGGSQPTYTTNAQAGNAVLNFDGVDDFLSVPHNTQLNPNTGGYTIFFVRKLFENPGVTGFYMSKGNSSSTTLGWSLVNSTASLRGRDSAGNSFNITNAYPSPSVIFQIASITFSGTTATTYLNNVLSGTPGTYVTTINSTSNLVLAASPSGTTPPHVQMGEVIFFNREFTTNEITKMDRYLANKWGISI